MGDVPSKYTCFICTKVLRDAHLTLCCGQYFCGSCLHHWENVKGHKTCPHCREGNFGHVLNKAIIREVNELIIRCTNGKKGCEWVGELGTLNDHLKSNKGCGYVYVKCTNKKCGEEMNRKELQLHLRKECDYRLYHCEHCGIQDTYQAITGKIWLGYLSPMELILSMYHYLECPEYPMSCRNHCGATGIKRKAMSDHRSSCPLEPLNCPFRDAGCFEKISRKDMADHMATNQQQHMIIAFECLNFRCTRLAKEIDTLEETIKYIQNQHSSLHCTSTETNAVHPAAEFE